MLGGAGRKNGRMWKATMSSHHSAMKAIGPMIGSPTL
jgi:hypothetical protein